MATSHTLHDININMNITLHYITLHYIALHALQYITLHCITLHDITYIALHCIAFHCTALHCTALHCIALHYTHIQNTSRYKMSDICTCIWYILLTDTYRHTQTQTHTCGYIHGWMDGWTSQEFASWSAPRPPKGDGVRGRCNQHAMVLSKKNQKEVDCILLHGHLRGTRTFQTVGLGLPYFQTKPILLWHCDTLFLFEAWLRSMKSPTSSSLS